MWKWFCLGICLGLCYIGAVLLFWHVERTGPYVAFSMSTVGMLASLVITWRSSLRQIETRSGSVLLGAAGTLLVGFLLIIAWMVATVIELLR